MFGMHGRAQELQFGIELQFATVEDFDFEDAYQEILTTKARADRINEIAAALKDQQPALDEKDALNAALIIAKVVGKQVFELEGNAHEALAALLLRIGSGGRP